MIPRSGNNSKSTSNPKDWNRTSLSNASKYKEEKIKEINDQLKKLEHNNALYQKNRNKHRWIDQRKKPTDNKLLMQKFIQNLLLSKNKNKQGNNNHNNINRQNNSDNVNWEGFLASVFGPRKSQS